MPERAHVTSLEAIEDFRAGLIIYVSKARPTLEEISGDVLRTRLWLQDEQRNRWENELRRRSKVLEQAQQALFSAQLSNLRETTDAEVVAVRRAKRAVEEAETKLKRVKQWSREFDSQIEPMAKQLDPLRNLLTIDMPKAVAHLAQVIKTLSDYAGITAAQDAAALSQPAAPKAAEDSGVSQTGAGPAQGGAA